MLLFGDYQQTLIGTMEDGPEIICVSKNACCMLAPHAQKTEYRNDINRQRYGHRK